VKHQWAPVIVHVMLLGPAGACAASTLFEAGNIPVDLRVPAGAVLAQTARAAGLQIYQCSADKGDAARFSWTLKQPEADLFDLAGHKIGKHYAGPTWEANDGSRVTGEVVARAASPVPNSVPWLLLRAKSASGNGLFGSVLFIQRLDTAGGNAPASGCGQSSGGAEARVPYTAEYRFYAAAP
jgi:Protein of unknown function (DUF3455)